MEALLIFLLVLIILSAFFSGVETALISLSSVKVNSLLAEKKRGAEALFRIKSNPHRLIITILIGNNIVNILASSIATVLATQTFGNIGVGIATGVMTLIILIFGEITPKSIAVQNAETISLLVAKPIEILNQILTPVIIIMEKLTGSIIKLFGVKGESKLTEEEL
ncbi:hypothetical protein A2164_01415 [Candidatus Curtissbacteria bacterium RBG_13_35_7]|uniref:CNNM transmembrane domain-containing protein n=1 Tax=Candidatus Curtissbacteria bacterium RBG_13_35_7 TaxID=1797705 RepID=A0A1F5G4V8_9BACT|nr:MAG: hypothetical protein A2164_01415 [Candidatus Curtissbacteria bacterium RBG_13_35_7]